MTDQTTKQKDWKKVMAQDEAPKKAIPKANTKKLEHPDYKELLTKLDEMEAKVNEHQNQTLLAKAEVENMRRRAEQRIADAHKFALTEMAKELLPIVDSLEHGLASCAAGESNDMVKKIQHGMELTYNMFLKTMQKFNIEQINPLDENFNPELHEAMSIKQDPQAKPNTVQQVLQKGYTLNGRLLRPALVIVAKAP